MDVEMNRLLEAVDRYANAKAAYDVAKSHSREAYFYQREELDRDAAKKVLGEALEALIVSVVNRRA